MTNIGNKSAPGAVKMRRELFFRAFAIALVTLASFLLAADIFIFVPITHQLASARLNQDSEQINGRLTAFVLRVETLSRVGRDWGAAGVFDLERKELLRDLFRSIVNNASESSGVVIADDTGHENLLIRLPDQTWLQRITNPVKWNKRGEFLTLDKDGRQMGREFKDTDYDARQRPWFKEGQMIPAGSSSVFWTEPFIFQSTQEPGVVAVVAYEGRSGRRYFLGHNLRLIDLSYFTSKVGTGPQGFSVVLADDGRVVGLPRAAKFSSEEDIKKLVLKNPDQIGVPPLASGYEAWQKGGRQENVLQKFSQNGIAWLAEFKKVSLGNRPLWVGTFAPEADLLPPTSSYIPLLVVLTIAALLLAWSIAMSVANRFTRQVEVAAREKREFIAHVIHEVNQPLFAIMLFSGGNKAKSLTLEQSREFLRQILLCTKQASKILGDLMDVTKFEAGEFRIISKTFDLGELLDQLKMTLSQKAEEKHIDLSIDHVPREVRHLIGDSLRLNQVLSNLINNAIKFTKKGGVSLKIKILTHDSLKRKCELQFLVEDTGVGIKKEELSRLFQSFSQANDSVAIEFGGSGLGLAICRELVKRMGGEISVESTYGVGSRFLFSLPFEVSK